MDYAKVLFSSNDWRKALIVLNLQGVPLDRFSPSVGIVVLHIHSLNTLNIFSKFYVALVSFTV